MRIDTHAHVFLRSLPTIPAARYVPDYDAPLPAYLALLDSLGLDRGVLVQPSFLGTDNSFLLNALAAAAGRLAGVVVLDEAPSETEAQALAAAGVRGVRFNLVGLSPALLMQPGSLAVMRLAARMGWHAELHADAPDLGNALGHLSRFDGPIVVDHFGRPGAGEGSLVAGWARDERIHVKLSAPYRVREPDIAGLTRHLLDAYGPERLMWGSDWPWTQHEAATNPAEIAPEALRLDAATVMAVHATGMRLFFSALS